WDIRAGQQTVPGRESEVPPAGQAVAVSVQTVTPTVTPLWLEATGTVRPELEAAVATKVMGRVQSVLAREGDRVRRGQPLVVLDARDLDAAIAQSDANLRAARVGYDNARVTAQMESALSAARIGEAQARVTQTEAALKAANAKLDLVQAGPRRQERAQAALSVAQAKSALLLAESNLSRNESLFKEGAISAQQYDQFRTQYEVARSQYETAQQAQSLTDEGSRAEEIRAAQEAVRQAQAAVQEARAGLKQARASAMQADVRRQEIQSAQAQIGQSQAALQIARVTRDYAVIASPFDGIVTRRLADPGAMASPGVPLLQVQGGSLRLEAVVPESALSAVRKGAAVPVRFDALGGRDLTGRVVEIAPQGDVSSHTFLVKIALPAGSGAAAGMFGRARFATGAEKRLLVPSAAVWEREGLHYLYVVDAANTARLRMVTVGEPVGERLPLLSGVNPGERIIVGGRERVTDGAQVTAEGR
ncbi:MAG TPA: efflux RND transporter periplasmic adaptor subunit, partial [Chthonomonadaceae bacterium]|nr:efflux RND transporter periplasmic adaptor subunit [Chthonomonadaceae bacterium]